MCVYIWPLPLGSPSQMPPHPTTLSYHKEWAELPMFYIDLCIVDSMEASLSRLQELVIDKEAWRAAIHGVANSRTWLSDWTELIPSPGDLPDPGIKQGSPALQVDSLPTELPEKPGTSLAVQWLRICLPMQRTWVRSLVEELRFCEPGGNWAHTPQTAEPSHILEPMLHNKRSPHCN